ncbi:MAG: SAM-dependent methyltransferase [bacterium]|nr:MAG: SAM-dependent methyltransferase [bacterium]
MKTTWDERYAQEGYLYGTEPNGFLKENFQQIPKGKVLFLAEGEGRNAVFLSKQGYTVSAMDSSSVAIEKAGKLARKNGVSITTHIADLNDFDLGQEQWDGIVSIFCHLPPVLRQAVYAKIVRALKTGGVFLAEAYTPKQLEFKTGGPPVKELLVDLSMLRKELKGLRFIHALETERIIHEGKFHFGKGAVVQVIAVKD